MINCLHCRHYFVTWDPNHPRGCRYFGFKGREMPAITVQKASGQACQAYTPKKTSG